jgi:hypothetical protein
LFANVLTGDDVLDTALGPPFARFTLICTLVIMYRTAFVMSRLVT